MSYRHLSVSRLAPALIIGFFLIAAEGCQEHAAYSANTNAAAQTDKTSGIDASRAYKHVQRLVEFGPRPSGSEEIKKAQQYIQSELTGYGLKVTEDQFDGETPRGSIPMKNIIGELRGDKPEIVMIAGHYDSKLMPGFVGANDGGSSAAAVLELARFLSKTKPEYTLWFVFFDGEEAVVDWNANDGNDNTYGSRHLVSKLRADGALGRTRALVLLDMIGDKSLDIVRDNESTPWMVDLIWGAARQIGYGKYFLNADGGYSDDHIPFKNAGVPVVDIIDFNYGHGNAYWHTTQDTLDKISGDSIKIVSDVVIRALPDLFKQLNARKGP